LEIYQKLSVEGVQTQFVGYEGITEAQSQVAAILKEGALADMIVEGEEAEIIVKETSFYGEIGGQVGDTGLIEGAGFQFEVKDARRPVDTIITHVGKLVRGSLKVGDAVRLTVNNETRRAIEANHSGTHILQAALKAVLGDHIKQSGSLVNAERLRFDFTHFSRITDEEMEAIETLANRHIRENAPVVTTVMPIDEAVKTGATAVFDEKYGDVVRVVKMGAVSMELCGGTHVNRTGDIGLLKIAHESAIAAGVRRIEALTGREAVKYVRKLEGELKNAANLVKANVFEVTDRMEKLLAHQKAQEKEIEALKSKLAAKDSSDLMDRLQEIKGIRILATEVEGMDTKTLRDFGDKMRDRIRSGIILLGSKNEGKAMLLCIVTKDLTDRYHAGNIIKAIAPIVGGSGGGRPDMAQAGGAKPENLEQALDKLPEMI
jgi:alanyl-tRNA synthetase